MYGDLIVFKRAYDEVTGLPKLASLTKQEVAAIRQHIVIGKVTLKDGSEVYTNILITTKAEVAE